MFDLAAFVKTTGYLGLFIVIFSESGVLLGLFFPGDSLLFTAGLLASQGFLNFPLILVLCAVAAVLGDNTGYAFGRKIGAKIFTRENSFFFDKNYLEKARLFYEKHGKKAVILARFMPVVRTLAPILAGVGNMNYSVFFLYNVFGGALWTFGITASGYFLGKTVKGIDQYIIPIVLLIIIASLAPSIVHFWKMKRAKKSRD